MNKKRIGFTIPEILMTLMIIGFIATVAIQAINVNRTAYVKLSYYAFNNLKGAVGELIIPETQGEGIIDKETGEGTYTEMRESPLCNDATNCFEERLIKTNDGLLRDGLYEKMNTQGNRNDDLNENLKIGALDIDEDDTPNFVTTNGQKYYIGKHQGGEPASGTYGYTIVAIDINGDGAPNSSAGVGSLPPDIISFAVLDSGEILPVGVAADNIQVGGKTYNYLTSKINAYRFKNPTGGAVPGFCTAKNGTQICDYDKVYLGNQVGEPDEAGNQKYIVAFTFRQAYCQARITYDDVLKDYCNGIDIHSSCPPNPGSTFDVCKQEIIKPVFRFNFN